MDKKREVLSKIYIWLPFLLASFLAVGMVIGAGLGSDSRGVMIEKYNNNGSVLGQGKVEELLRYIEAKYVDEINRDELVDVAIESILNELDPHSTYITAEQFDAVNDPLEGNFEGIGVEFMILEDTIVIVNPIEGGPSIEVGLKVGDKLISVGDSIVAGVNITSEGIKELLRGQEGSDVKIGIQRNGEKDLLYFDITRAEIPMHSLDAAYMIDPSTAFVKINRFSATAHQEFVDALEKILDENTVSKLVIDLRHNPGGYLQQATSILSQIFRDRDNLLVYTEGAKSNRKDYESTGNRHFNIGKVAVLIDEGSASASEILAGAVQDYDRGFLIGRRSYGKGLVQEQVRLKDGSALRLTVARYYTPSGRSIQRPYNDLNKYENDLIERYNSGELLFENDIFVEDSTSFYTRNGRVVYGGGGITPDFFVPIDTVLFVDTYERLRREIASFVFKTFEADLVNQEKNQLTFRKFKSTFKMTEDIWNQFLEYADSHNVSYDTNELAQVKPYLKRMMKAELAKLLFDTSAFYEVWYGKDPVVAKAIEVLNDPSSLTVLK